MKREHRHEWKQAGTIRHVAKSIPNSAGPVVAKVYECRCGAYREELTAVGVQQRDLGEAWE